MSNDTPALLMARIKQVAQTQSVELEGGFLKDMTEARLSPQPERLELIGRYAENNFYVRAKAMLAISLVSNWRWPSIEKRVEQEIENTAVLHAGHPLARAIDYDAALDEWISQRIRRSGEWHKILRHLHQIRAANLSPQQRLHFVESWAAGESSNTDSLEAPTSAPPSIRASAAKPTRPGRGRPPKYSDAQFEEVLRRKGAGESYRVASTVFNGKANPTPEDGCRAREAVRAYQKRKGKK
jgi:hypothetical protein